MWLLLAPAVSSHISGWLKEWREVFSPVAGILHLVLEAFWGYSQVWLGTAANLVGAREGLEVLTSCKTNASRERCSGGHLLQLALM